MKTERRHELQHNSLADALTDWIESVKPYSTAILGGIIAIVVLVGVAMYLSQQTQQQQQAAWDEVFVASEPNADNRERLLEVAKDYGDSPAGAYARLMAANAQLNDGINQLFTDKASGTAELRKAIDNYTQVTNATNQPLFKQQAAMGLARAHESLNELPKAREYYQQVVALHGVLEPQAEARLKDLDRKPTKDFYDWFAQQSPRPRLDNQPGIPGLRPDFELPSNGLPPDIGSALEPFGVEGSTPPSTIGATPSGDAKTNATPDSTAPTTPDGPTIQP